MSPDQHALQPFSLAAVPLFHRHPKICLPALESLYLSKGRRKPTHAIAAVLAIANRSIYMSFV